VTFIRNPQNDSDELEQLRAGVDCSTVLERAGFLLDKSESTRNSPKYRNDDGWVVIVNHGGRGWWDPHDSVAKGDVFKLVQYLNPGMTLGRVRQMLRPIVGISPTAAAMPTPERAPPVPCTVRWRGRPKVRPGSAVWTYLTGTRALPAGVVIEAGRQDVLREGSHGTAWFAHRDRADRLTGIEMRGPDYRGFSTGGDKALFRFRAGGKATTQRLVVCEAPIDALSFAAVDPFGTQTLYVATAGGMGPRTIEELQALFADLAATGGRLLIATDNDKQGDRYAEVLEEMAQAVSLSSRRALPTGDANDWNAVLQRRGAT